MPSLPPRYSPKSTRVFPLKGKRNHSTELIKGYMWLTPDVKKDIQHLINMTSQHHVGKLLKYNGNKSYSARCLVDGTRRQIREDKYALVVAELKKLDKNVV